MLVLGGKVSGVVCVQAVPSSLVDMNTGVIDTHGGMQLGKFQQCLDKYSPRNDQSRTRGQRILALTHETKRISTYNTED